MLNLIFFSLFLQLAIGALLPLFFISLEDIGVFFFRFVSVLVAALLVLAWWAHPFDHPMLSSAQTISSFSQNSFFSLIAATIAVLLAGSIMIKRVGKSYLFPAFALGLLGIIAAALISPTAQILPPASSAWRVASFIGSALVLGTVLSAMITGHWYLVNRRLTIQPLRVATQLFLGATLLRLALVVAAVSALLLSREALVAQSAQALLQFSGTGWLFWLRVIIGLAGPLIFGFMIYETVKIRSTQSATGMLYATVIFVVIGEAFSKFIWLFTGISI